MKLQLQSPVLDFQINWQPNQRKPPT